MKTYKGQLVVVRDGEIKLRFAMSSVQVKTDGTLWVGGNPILGVEDPTEKKRIKALTKKRQYDQIPDKYFTRLGDNPNGLWAGSDEEWDKHPAKVEADRKAAEKAAEKAAKDAKTVTIYLSSRGWGDYSSCEWRGDITRPDAEILAECKDLLSTEHDVDRPDQSDKELLDMITKAREKWETAPARKAAREAKEAADIQRKIDTGYCFNCESWCDGDCGHYSNDPMTRYRRELKEAQREQNFGINED